MRDNRMIFSNSNYIKSSPEYFLKDLEKHGVQKIEFLAASPYFSCYDYPQAKQREKAAWEWRSMLEDRGAAVYSLAPEYHTYPVNLADSNPEIRSRSIRYYQEYIEDAAILGAEYVYVNPGWYYLDEGHKKGFRLGTDSMKILLEQADKLGKKLLIGPLLTESTNIVRDYETVLAFLEKTGGDRLYAALEMESLLEQGENPYWYLNVLKEKVACLRTVFWGKAFQKQKFEKCFFKGTGGLPIVVHPEDGESWEEEL